MELALRNRVAVVSASSQGIGRAIAIALAVEGAHLALCARNSAVLGSLAHEIRERHGVRVHAEALDVRESEAIMSFVSSAASVFGGIDICVTNAGGPPAKAFLATTRADWDDAFALNLRSAVEFAKACIPYMQRSGWGRIVTISSITVRQPQPDLVLSNAIRAGVAGWRGPSPMISASTESPSTTWRQDTPPPSGSNSWPPNAPRLRAKANPKSSRSGSTRYR